MHPVALGGIGTLRPLALHPLEIGEARAVDVLVDHARRQERRFLRKGRRFERELALLGRVGHPAPSSHGWLAMPAGRIHPHPQGNGCSEAPWQLRTRSDA